MLRSEGIRVPPLDLLVSSDVPIGVGLSSSAALEVATLRAIRTLLGLRLSDLEVARLAHRAETEYADVACGIMDQFACSLGTPGCMLFIDTRTLEFRELAIPAHIVVVDSGTPRSLANTAYNARRTNARKPRGRRVQPSRHPDLRSSSVPPVPHCGPPTWCPRHQRVLAALEPQHHLSACKNASTRPADDFEVPPPRLTCLRALHASRRHGRGSRGRIGGALLALVAVGMKRSRHGRTRDT